MKKLLIASSLLVSSSAMATGFYAGGQLGLASFDIKEKNSSLENRLGSHGATYGIYAGYRYDLDSLFIAGELDLNANTAKPKEDIEEYTQDDKVGFHLLAGTPIGGNTEIYGRLGVVKTKFKFKSEDNSTPDESKTKQGTALGFGMQHQWDSMLTLRLDYKYINYKKLSFTSGSTTKHTPTDQLFAVGIQYSF